MTDTERLKVLTVILQEIDASMGALTARRERVVHEMRVARGVPARRKATTPRTGTHLEWAACIVTANPGTTVETVARVMGTLPRRARGFLNRLANRYGAVECKEDLWYPVPGAAVGTLRTAITVTLRDATTPLAASAIYDGVRFHIRDARRANVVNELHRLVFHHVVECVLRANEEHGALYALKVQTA